jgi:hypothetical protein
MKWKHEEGSGICVTKVLFRRLLGETGENYKNSCRFAGMPAEICAGHARTLVSSFTTWYKMLICNGAMYLWECRNKRIFDFNKIPGEERALSLVKWFIHVGWASKYVDCRGRTAASAGHFDFSAWCYMFRFLKMRSTDTPVSICDHFD